MVEIKEGDEIPIRRRHRRVSLLADDPVVEDDPPNDEDEDDDEDYNDDKYSKYAKQRVKSVVARDSKVTPKRRRSTRLLDDSVSSHSTSLTSRALSSLTQTAARSFKSNRVDALLAALGCSVSLALLQWQSLQWPTYPLLHSCLVSSAVKFFFNETPTTLSAFWQSSIFALLQGLTLHFVPAHCGIYAKYVLMFVMMMYWKLQGGLWGAADAMGLTVAMESGGWRGLFYPTTTTTSSSLPWKFLFLQYLGGHLLLYGMASLLSIVRRQVRVWLIRQEFLSKEILGVDDPTLAAGTTMVSGNERRQRLWNLFQRMDTSGDGQLDAVELQVALRAATATDISIADTNAIIRSVDCDGNGTVDFDEFCASIEKFWG